MEKTWRWFGSKDRITLDMLRQIGVEGVVTALHEVPNGEVWTYEAIMERKSLIESHGLRWSVVESLPVNESIKYAGAERDRHPWQQPPGAGFRPRPAAQRFDQRRPDAKVRRHIPSCLRGGGGARRPSPGIASPAARRFTLLGHATPCDPIVTTRLPEGEWRRKGTDGKPAGSPRSYRTRSISASVAET